jgi:predicted amidophosphoribosyltransferase
MEIKQDEIHVTYIVHGGNPKDCRRCQKSVRPSCSNCGHSLSGNIDNKNKWTTCEFCFTRQSIEP